MKYTPHMPGICILCLAFIGSAAALSLGDLQSRSRIDLVNTISSGLPSTADTSGLCQEPDTSKPTSKPAPIAPGTLSSSSKISGRLEELITSSIDTGYPDSPSSAGTCEVSAVLVAPKPTPEPTLTTTTTPSSSSRISGRLKELINSSASSIHTTAVSTAVPLPTQSGGPIRLAVDLPQSLAYDVRYPVIPDPDSVRGFIVMSPDLGKPQQSIPTEDEAVSYAEEILDSYGGLPDDAVLTEVEQRYIEVFDSSIGATVQKVPAYTSVRYGRVLNGNDIVGGGGTIQLNLGEQGELLSLYMIWHRTGDPVPVPIITAGEAFVLVKQGDVLRRCVCPGSMTINSVRLGYYEKRTRNRPAIYRAGLDIRRHL